MHRLLGATLIAISSLGCSDDPADSAAENPAGSGGTGTSGGGGHGGLGTGGAGAGGVFHGSGGESGGLNAGGALAAGGASGGSDGDGSGGAGGTDAQHVVGACDGLGAEGVWEEISPIPGDNPALMTSDWLATGQGTKWGGIAISVHPNQSGTVYVSVPRGGIWKSTDCGASWTKTNTGTAGAILDSGIQFIMQLAAGSPDTLYAENFQGSSLSGFKSIDGGANWAALYGSDSVVTTHVEYGGYANDIRLNPSDDQHLLMNFHANCSAPYNGGCIGESTDAGATWTLIDGPLDAWAEGASVYFITATKWLFGAHAGLFYTPDSGATWNQVAQSANIGGLVHAPSGVYYLGSDQGVLQSEDGQAWSLISGSPPTIALVGTGETLYAGDFLTISGPTADVIWSAPEDNPTTWTKVTTPIMSTLGGPWRLDYDADHHVLYSANKSSGLWRSVVP